MFVNDIFKKKQITEANVKKPQPYNEPGWTRKLSKQELDALAGYNEKSIKDIKKEKQDKKQDVKEAGPFSYGAKKPRKGSVADLAAQKRKEQERGKQPAEPKDQRVGVARVVKDVAEGRGNIEALRTELMGEYLNIYYNALDGWNMTDHIINLQDVYGRVKRSRDPVLQQTYNLLMDHAEESIDVQASAALKAIRILGDEPNYTPPPRPPMSPEDSARADAFVNKFLAALVSHGIKTHPDWQKNNDKGVAEGSFDNASPMTKDSVKQDRIRSLKNLIAIAKEKGRQLRVQELELELKKLQGVAEGNLAEFAPSGGGGGRWYSDDQLYDIVGEDWLEAFDVSGDQGNIDLRGERARLFLAQEAEAWLTDRGYRVNVLDVRDDGDELSWYIQGPLYRGLAEGSGVTKLNDYNQWLDKVDAQGAEKHMQKNRTLIVAQSWDGEKVGEFDTSSNQGWVMSHSEKNVAEGSTQDKLYKRHQELRKKSGLPDPDYYKELKTTYDLPDDERHAKQKEIKQKYKITNEDREQYIEELQRAGYEIVNEKRMTCPECGGAAYADQMLAEKQDACYHKVKSRYKVWPSAYASGALVRCRKKGAKNWGNKSKK